MKSILFRISLLLLLVTALTGCCSIPTKRSVTNEKVFGERRDKHGNVLEQVVRREVTWIWYNLWTLEQIGEWGQTRSEKFYLKRGEKSYRLSGIHKVEHEFSETSYDIETPILPVAGTDKWVAARLFDLEVDEVGVAFIVFNRSGICHKMKVAKCLRGDYPFTTFSTYAIEAREGNTKFHIQTKDGRYILDVLSRKIEKLGM